MATYNPDKKLKNIIKFTEIEISLKITISSLLSRRAPKGTGATLSAAYLLVRF